MIAIENVNTFVTGVFPDAEADNSTGAATQDGFEFIAEYINNSIIGPQQAIMDYAGLTPDGVTEAAGASQMIEAWGKAFGVGPGRGVTWWLDDGPAVTGDRVLLLTGQGVLIASYVELDAVVYVGDGNNAAVEAGGGFFYRSSDAGGATPDIAGPYLQLPDLRGYALRGLDVAAAVDPDGASRFLGDVQLDAMQEIEGQIDFINNNSVTAMDTCSGAFAPSGGNTNSAAFPSTDTPNSTDNAIFRASQSTSPNAAKTDDDETRMTNISTNYGITY